MASKSAELPPEERRIFDFFNLPLELRHMIYDHLANHKTEFCSSSFSQQHGERVALEGQQQPHLLRINKQFSEEYLPRFKRVTKTLVLTHISRRPPLPRFGLPAVGRYLRDIKKVTVNVFLHYARHFGGPRTFGQFLYSLNFYGNTVWLRLAAMLWAALGVEDTEIRVFTERKINMQDPRVRAPVGAMLDRLTQLRLPGLSLIRVVSFGKKDDTTKASRKCGQYGKWTAEGGWDWR
ncbi:unnamed protein product [Cercospora beticola]|nr:unnamed protein product [Cercospora beticola]